ncbi:MAG: hypothetical protein M3N26_09725 [Pseudomonadota bacterium]|nr:hypothetical protein [Pseudomonadota bacterium]
MPFQDGDTEVVTKLISDYLGGGEPDPEPCADVLFHAAYRLAHADIRVIAVMRPPTDAAKRLFFAATRTRSSFALAHLHAQLRPGEWVSCDVAVRDGSRIDLLCDLVLHVSAKGRAAFVPATRRGPAVLWRGNDLRIADLPWRR